MRDLKFRAWDECNKIMHSSFKCITSGDSGNDWIVFISNIFTLENHETNPFTNPNPYFSRQLKKMQFTGIVDKNGVDIYEGDIIAKPNNVCGVMVWKAPSFEVTVSGEQSSLYSLEYFEDAIVVGNIYENSELLSVGE